MAIQLDDDELVLMTWALAARKAKVGLRQFRDASSFLASLQEFSKESDFFIDAQLAHGVRGEEIARQLYDYGFRRIYLATGMPPDSFSGLNWLAGVVGKDPPW